MELTEKSLILRTGKFRENDMWVRMLTPNHGMLTAFAFGASRSRRRFMGCLDSYNHVISRFSSSKNGQFLNLQETSLLESYGNIRHDWRKQGLVANCIRFLEALGVSAHDSQKVFEITQSLLLFINENSELHHMLPLLYRYRMAAESGYALELDQCQFCQNDLHSGGLFLVSDGRFVCKTCKPLGISALTASKECLELLQFIQDNSPLYWGQLDISAQTWRESGQIIDALVRYHLGLEWVDGRFKRNA